MVPAENGLTWGRGPLGRGISKEKGGTRGNGVLKSPGRGRGKGGLGKGMLGGREAAGEDPAGACNSDPGLTQVPFPGAQDLRGHLC